MADEKKDSTVERRCLDSQYQEMRLNFDSKTPKITGYAAVFNVITELWPGFREQIAPGAFADSIKKDDIRALWNHNPDYLLGRNSSGSLKLWEDEKGLAYEITPPDTQWAKDLMTLMKRGDLSQSSFGFNIIKRSVEVNEKKDEMLRTIEKAQLFDVSPVTFPAYPQTEVHVRMTTNEKNELEYFVGDKVIETISLETDKEARNEKNEKKEDPPAELSDEEIFAECDEILKGVFRK